MNRSDSRLAGLGALGLGVITVTLFLYVLLMPWITGEEPNVCHILDDLLSTQPLTLFIFLQYQTWRDSGILSSVIPVSERMLNSVIHVMAKRR